MSVMRLACAAAVAALAGLAVSAGFAQSAFPFDRDLVLDARPMRGSKRVPILSIDESGRAQIDLWCRSGAGQVVVSGATIKITLGPLREDACTPERARRDEEMAAALSEVTRWRTDGDRVVLVGPTELRFLLSAH